MLKQRGFRERDRMLSDLTNAARTELYGELFSTSLVDGVFENTPQVATGRSHCARTFGKDVTRSLASGKNEGRAYRKTSNIVSRRESAGETSFDRWCSSHQVRVFKKTKKQQKRAAANRQTMDHKNSIRTRIESP